MRFKPWQLVVILLLVCGIALGIMQWRVRRFSDAASLLQALPPDRATHLYVSLNALRDSGILGLFAGSTAEEESDYRNFVQQTGFDYREDLDAIAAAFLPNGSYFTARGRFDWKKLRAYATDHGGECRNLTCSLPASDPGRYISYYPLATDTIALAFAPEQFGVNMIAPAQWSKQPPISSEPIWVSAPSFVFSDPKGLPAGAQAFLSPFAQAEHVTFGVVPEGESLAIRVDASCATPESASGVARKLTETTDLLKKMLARDNMTPNPNDLSGVLVAGTFSSQGTHVSGKWPVARGFLTALATGKIQ